jgi:hypothetical protein
MGAEVDYQVAAPAEMSTPNLHRAKIAQKECGWKDGDRGGSARMPSKPQKEGENKKRKTPLQERRKTFLTLTGLLMEGPKRFDRCPLSQPCLVSQEVNIFPTSHLPIAVY